MNNTRINAIVLEPTYRTIRRDEKRRNTEISLKVRKKTVNDSLTMTINRYGRRGVVA
jgi:hypothetical protein